MPSRIRELEAIPQGKGLTLRFYVDESLPQNSFDSRWTEVTSEGGPDDEVLEVPSHWHRYHDEFWKCLEGEFAVVVNGKQYTLTPESPVVMVPRTERHSLKAVKGKRCTIREMTNPTGEFKQEFFRDLYTGTHPFKFWAAMRVLYDGDSFPDTNMGFQAIDVLFIYVFGLLAKIFGPPSRPDTTHAKGFHDEEISAKNVDEHGRNLKDSRFSSQRLQSKET